jgi:hypothetical protein
MATNYQKSIISNSESFTKFPAVIQTDHAYIHAGIGFTMAIDLRIISVATYIGLTTPASSSGYLHFRPGSTNVSTDTAAVEYVFYEDVTSYSGGTAYTPFNRNRNSSKTSGATILSGTTPVLGTPLILDVARYGSAGSPAARSGGSGSGGNDEIILKPSTDYVFAFTPAAATSVTFNAFWYEEVEGI